MSLYPHQVNIQLNDDQIDWCAAMSERFGVSRAEAIRQCIDRGRAGAERAFQRRLDRSMRAGRSFT